jgi:hypothetical protein
VRRLGGCGARAAHTIALVCAAGLALAPAGSLARDVVGTGNVLLEWSPAAGAASAYAVFVSRDGGPYRSEQYTTEPRARVAGRTGETVQVLVRAYAVARGRTLGSAPSEPSEPIRFLAAPPPTSAVSAPPPSAAPAVAALPAPERAASSFSPPPFAVQAAGDFDGDGERDLLATLGSWRHPLALFLEGGEVSALACLAPFEATASAFGADFDGDGRDELAVRGAAGVSVLRLERSSAPVLLRRETLPSGARVLAADLDGDARASLVIWDPANGRLSEWTLAGAAKNDFGAIQPLHGLAAGDFDGDGRDDLWIQTRAGGEAELWLMREGGDFAVEKLRIDGKVRSATAVDWNGDGRADLAGYDEVRDELRAWLLDGGRVVARRELGRGPVESLRALDLDGDGREDLLVSAPGAPPNGLLSTE